MSSAMTKEMQSALLAGIISAALFIIVYAIGLGFIFMFLPTLPLFFAGLQNGASVVMRGGAVSAIIILLAVGVASSFVYMLVLWLPAWHIVNGTMRYKLSDDESRLWFPMGAIMANLSLYAVTFIGFMVVYYSNESGGLPGMLSTHLASSIEELQVDYGEAMGMMARQWAFLIFPITIWLWAFCLYGHVWLATRLLQQKGRAVRPDVAITPFCMPGWVLYLLAVSALASLIGGTSMQFLGKSALIILLLPYFFSGIAHIHAASQTWPSRRFLLFFIYFSIFAQIWPALCIAAVGLWQQLKTLNKHLPRGGSSSNN